DMARSLGKSARILKSEAKAMKKDGEAEDAATAHPRPGACTPAPAPAPARRRCPPPPPPPPGGAGPPRPRPHGTTRRLRSVRRHLPDLST
ncbi:hypothetical protein, partial [Streptomyces sp. NPDC041003]|uniref:hypothetical protein n=1 Tax=Streptomyces sp. NPDC041003 TaxID=3155730 RepID=UPI0034115620